jgi:hypothetical protein
MPLAKMFPHLTITNQDLPEAINLAQEVSPDIQSTQLSQIYQCLQTWERDAHETLLDGRVEFVAFNFLEDVPVAGQDVYYVRARTSFHTSPVTQ